MPYSNRKKQLEAQREHYRKNKPEYRKRWAEKRKENKLYIENYKRERPCSCGEARIACLDFHHVRGKEILISKAIRDWSRDRIEKEISKCEIICSNCHRKHHRNDFKRTTKNKKRIRNREFVDAYKQSKSCDCGETDSVCLDFHHLRDKEIDIARAVQDWGIKRLKNEIEKCEILCANCHRVLHNGD